MKYLPGFLTEQSVKDFSQSLYTRPAGALTMYMFGWIKHPERNEWALIVPGVDAVILPEEKQAALQEFAALELDNWFVAGVN